MARRAARSLPSEAISPETQDLERLLRHRRSIRRKPTSEPLKDILVPWYKKEVARPGQQLGELVEIWNALVPPRIVNHSRLASLLKNTLHVQLDNATARAELERLLRGTLLGQLQNLSRGQVYKVKTSLGS